MYATPTDKDRAGGDCFAPQYENDEEDLASTVAIKIGDFDYAKETKGQPVGPSAKDTGGAQFEHTTQDTGGSLISPTGGDHVSPTGKYSKTEEGRRGSKSLSASCPHILPLLKNKVIGAPKINSEIGQMIFDPQNKHKKFIR